MTELPKIPLAGVIGHPIAHSRSPALHGFWLRRYGVKGHYVPMDVAPTDLETTLPQLPQQVQATGVSVSQSTPSILLVTSFAARARHAAE